MLGVMKYVSDPSCRKLVRREEESSRAECEVMMRFKKKRRIWHVTEMFHIMLRSSENTLNAFLGALEYR